MNELIGRGQQRIDELAFRLAGAERRRLQEYRSRLEVASARLRLQDMRRTLAAMRRDLEVRASALASAVRSELVRRRGRWEGLQGRLQALSPLNILERGYALVFDEKGTLVKDAAQVKTGEEIRARVSRGTIDATVKKTSG
jgi:exodeoxyribonuclease VII large subunit